METSFAAAYTYLVKTGKMSLSRLVEKMSVNPARRLKIPAGTLSVGAPADINRDWVVEPDKLHSKARNAVYKGMTLTGKVMTTFCGGRLVYTG